MLYIPCTKTTNLSKMFIYMLFYIDLTVQLEWTIERLMLQKFVRFLLVVALIACFVSWKSRGKGKGRKFNNNILYFYFEFIVMLMTDLMVHRLTKIMNKDIWSILKHIKYVINCANKLPLKFYPFLFR